MISSDGALTVAAIVLNSGGDFVCWWFDFDAVAIIAQLFYFCLGVIDCAGTAQQGVLAITGTLLLGAARSRGQWLIGTGGAGSLRSASKGAGQLFLVFGRDGGGSGDLLVK
jgi:hypothetical protein